MQERATIAFITLGCAKNEVDSNKMRTRLLDAGYAVIDDASAAELVIVNTCAFLTSAVEEGLEVIFDIAGSESRGDAKPKVLVAGCMPARYGDDLASELVEATEFLPAADEDRIVEVVSRLLGEPAGTACEMPRLRDEAGPSAYVKISDGCDRFCSYCMIPHIRGRYHSYPFEQIDAEVCELVASGVREIVLIGQDTGIWGHDLPGTHNTAKLVSALAERYADTWFRLLYVQPEGISDELLDAIATHGNICSYLDMPLQHANEEVLERMNRSGSARSYLDLIEHVRERVDGILIRTTFMAGFPGETPEQYEELLDFADEAQFDYAAVFPFSPEEGSAAFSFEGQIDDEERYERAQRLLDACEAIGTSRMEALVGTDADVLVEGYEQTDAGLEALCRLQGQAPEVDGQVHVPIESPDALRIGDIARVSITGSFFYELEGELVAP